MSAPRLCLALGFVAALAGLSRPVAAQRAGTGLNCDLCHGELELLRQHTDSLEQARRLLAPAAVLEASAHGGLACADCHQGIASFPHSPGSAGSATCQSCHEDADAAWRAGVHARERKGRVACGACHGVHDVRPLAALREASGVRTLNGRCVGCHETRRLPPLDAHADSIACASCHGAHRIGAAGDPASALAHGRQAATCGACHPAVAASWRGDAHGLAALAARPDDGGAGERVEERPGPACTTCHGGHGMRSAAEEAFAAEATHRCAGCHEEYGETFGDSYHGQATALGSVAAARCFDCHPAHDVRPASDPRSTVAPARLVGTCGRCHTRASASFVGFQPHANPHDRDRNPLLYWTYKGMTLLLTSVFIIFGLHTALWLLRLGIQRVRGEPAPRGPGPGEAHGP